MSVVLLGADILVAHLRVIIGHWQSGDRRQTSNSLVTLGEVY